MIQKIRNNRFAKNSLILLAGTIAANFLNYIFHLAVGRMASASVYGEVESLISFMNIITIPAVALSMTAANFSAGYMARDDRQENQKFLKRINVKIAKWGVPFFLLAVVLTPWINDFFKIESTSSFIFLWLIMLLSFFMAAVNGVLVGWQKFKEISWSGIAGSFMKLAIAMAAIKMGLETGGIMSGFLIGSVATYLIIILYLRFLKEKRREGDIQNPKNISSASQSVKDYIWPVLVANVALAILSNADMVIAKHNMDAISSGQYGALTVVSKIIFFITGILATVLFSMSSESHYKKTNSAKIFRDSLLATLVLSVVALGFYFFLPKLILGIFFGSKYYAVTGYLGWLAIAVVIFSLTNLIIQYQLSHRDTGFVYVLLFFSFIFILALLFWGNGISAIIETTVTVQLVTLMASIIYLYRSKIRRQSFQGNLKY